jgi:hypothetical protein
MEENLSFHSNKDSEREARAIRLSSFFILPASKMTLIETAVDASASLRPIFLLFRIGGPSGRFFLHTCYVVQECAF